MINKIRELMELKEVLDRLTEKTDKLDQSNARQAESAQMLHQQLGEILNENKKVLAQAKKDADSMREFRKALEKELYEFRLFKKEVRADMEKCLKNELGDLTLAAKEHVTGFNEAKKGIELKMDAMNRLDEEIKRLQAVVSQIKVQDFELSRHKKDMEKAANEKMDLIRRIDSLQTLVARMRRRHS